MSCGAVEGEIDIVEHVNTISKEYVSSVKPQVTKDRVHATRALIVTVCRPGG